MKITAAPGETLILRKSEAKRLQTFIDNVSEVTLVNEGVTLILGDDIMNFRLLNKDILFMIDSRLKWIEKEIILLEHEINLNPKK